MKMDQVLLRDEVALAATALQSDPILFWNEVALEANRVSHTNGKNEQTGPALSSRALAIVHLAMYDAYAGVIKDTTNLAPYIGGIPAPPGASSDAAVAAAAPQNFLKFFPRQKTLFYLSLSVTGETTDPGHNFWEGGGPQKKSFME